MENLNAEQAINELETQTKYAKFIGSNVVTLSAKCATFVLEHAQFYEQRIKELTEEYESMAKSVNEASELIRKLRTEKKELTEENERLRADCVKGANALIEEIQKNRTIEADTVRETHSEIKERCIKGGIYPAFVARVVEEVAKEIANE